MCADVAQTALVELDPIDFDNYVDGGSSTSNFAPPPEGKYFGTAPTITDANFGATREGYLKLNLDPITIVNPNGPGDGYQVKFASLSAKKYKNREGSQMGDFLRACGVGARPTTNEQMKTALKMCAGRRFQFGLVWEAYNKNTQESISGEANFPINSETQQRQSWIKDEYDSTKKWYANGKIKYFVSALSKG